MFKNILGVICAVSLGGVALSWTACSQDPLANQSKAVQDAIPAGGVFKKPVQPEREDVLKVDVMDAYTFAEESVGEISVKGRVLKQINGHNPVLGQDFTFSIANMDDFPGATFDPTTYKFSWTPKSVTGDQMQAVRTLKIIISTIGTSPIQSRIWPTTIFVTHKEIDPEIRSVFPASFDIVSGDTVKFNVVVYDPDTAMSSSKIPHLHALDAQKGTQSLAGYVSLDDSWSSDPNPKQDLSNAALWTYRMVLNTNGADLSGDLSFALEAVSRFGHRANKNVSVHVRPYLAAPVSTLVDNIAVKAGAESTITFSVYDPLGRGSMQTSINCSDIPNADQCACTAYRQSSISDCTIHWVAPAVTTATHYNISVHAINGSPMSSDSRTSEKDFTSVIDVTPLPPPTPTPSPVPSPTPGPSPKPVLK